MQEMVNYSVAILPRAQKQLAKLPADQYPRVRDAIHALAENPRPPGCLKLSGREGWRLRVGKYRVIYEIDDIVDAVDPDKVIRFGSSVPYPTRRSSSFSLRSRVKGLLSFGVRHKAMPMNPPL